MSKLIYPCLAALGLLAMAWACDSGNPVAPSPPDVAPAPAGVTYSLGLSISPSQLVAGSGVPGTVTVTATRNDNGEAPDNGTLVTLTTDKGDFGGDNGDLVMLGLSDGSATASLFPADTPDTATLLAQLSDSSTSTTVEFVEETAATLFISSVVPQSGSAEGGTRVTISGGGFAAPLNVVIGGGQATVLSVSSSAIVVNTPRSAQPVAAGDTMTVDVTVDNALDSADPGSTTFAGGFVYTGAGVNPVFITDVDPSTGPADQTTAVTISGGGFVAPAQVDFGGKAGTGVSVASASTITVTAPTSAQPVDPGDTLTVDVTVTSGVDQSSPQSATLAGGFTYTGDQVAPVFITGVDPDSGPADQTTPVTISGGGFEAPAQVDFGGKAGTGVSVSPNGTAITVTAPTSAQPVDPGDTLAVDVTVTSGVDQSSPQTATLAGGFTYLGDAAIVVSAIAPTRGSYEGGTSVTVTGQNFGSPGDAVSVELEGIRQRGPGGTTAETVVNSTRIDFSTAGIAADSCPASGQVAQTGIVVTHLGTGASGSADLTFNYTLPAPRIDSLSPTGGGQSSGVTVTLSGASFSSPARVDFVISGQSFTATVLSVSGSQIRVTSPSVPTSVFPEVACTTDSNETGMRYDNVTADVTVTLLDTGCEDTLGNAFTFSPNDTSCRP